MVHSDATIHANLLYEFTNQLKATGVTCRIRNLFGEHVVRYEVKQMSLLSILLSHPTKNELITSILAGRCWTMI